MTEWNIQSRAHTCAACGRAFADKEVFHTLLFDEKSELQRSDICQECWHSQHSHGVRDRKGFVSYWHGTYDAPSPQPEPIHRETAESLLRKLIEQNDPRFVAAGYILAVMLERKRVLKVKEQFIRDGKRLFIYEQPRTGDVFTIVDPNLQLDQLEQVQHDVAALLEQGLNPASDPPSAPGPETVANEEASKGIFSPQEPEKAGKKTLDSFRTPPDSIAAGSEDSSASN